METSLPGMTGHNGTKNPQNGGLKIVSGDSELWSDRAHRTIWMEPANQNNPCVVDGVWFWRVDIEFIARVARLIAKSKETKTPIDPPELDRMRALWWMSEEQHPGVWAALPNNQHPGRLPGIETLDEVHEFMRFGLIPKTACWKPREEKDGPTSPAEPAPRPISKPKRVTTPEMF